MKRKLLRKLLAVILPVILLLSAIPLSASAMKETLPNYFNDVPDGKWYTNAVLSCYQYGYMNGTGNGAFSPTVNVTREMFATLLYNVDGATDTYETYSFADLPAGKWFSNPVEWCYQNNYSNGNGKTQGDKPMYGVGDFVTRESVVTYLFRYSNAKGYDVTGRRELNAYTDADEIHSWAKDAMSWAVANGIVNGTSETTLAPRATATRAQVAKVISTFLDVFGHHWDTGVVLTKRSCTVNGVVKFTCTDKDCTAERTVTQKAFHTWNNGVVSKYPNCTTDGLMLYTCLVCYKTKNEPISMTGHSYQNGVCGGCGDVIPQQVLLGNWRCYGFVYNNYLYTFTGEQPQLMVFPDNMAYLDGNWSRWQQTDYDADGVWFAFESFGLGLFSPTDREFALLLYGQEDYVYLFRREA